MIEIAEIEEHIYLSIYIIEIAEIEEYISLYI